MVIPLLTPVSTSVNSNSHELMNSCPCQQLAPYGATYYGILLCFSFTISWSCIMANDVECFKHFNICALEFWVRRSRVAVLNLWVATPLPNLQLQKKIYIRIYNSNKIYSYEVAMKTLLWLWVPPIGGAVLKGCNTRKMRTSDLEAALV